MLKRLMLRAALCCLPLLACGPASAADDGLMRELARLEQAYIKPLFFSNKGDLTATRSSMAELQQRWQEASPRLRSRQAPTEQWNTHLDTMGTAISRAAADLASDNPTLLKGSVHASLEEVRDAMLLLRSRSGLPCATTDRMTLFHGEMEQLLEPLMDVGPAGLTPAQMTAMRGTLHKAAAAWKGVEACPVDADSWGLGKEDLAALQQLFAAEGKALADLDQALESGNRPGIKAGAMAVRQTFARAYLRFAGMVLP